MGRILILIALMLTLCGCKMPNDRVDIVTGDILYFDDTSISIDANYTFKDFTKEYNKDDTCTVTINFIKK